MLIDSFQRALHDSWSLERAAGAFQATGYMAREAAGSISRGDLIDTYSMAVPTAFFAVVGVEFLAMGAVDVAVEVADDVVDKLTDSST